MIAQNKFSKAYREASGLLVVLVILTAGIIYTALGIGQNQTQEISTKTAAIYKVNVEFDRQEQRAEISSVETLRDKIVGLSTTDHISPYSVLILDENNNELMRKNITVSETIIAHPQHVDTISEETIEETLPLPEIIGTSLYLPYYPNGAKIEILKDNQIETEITIPTDETNLSLTPSTNIADVSAGKYKVVIVGEGFSDDASFQAKVNAFKSSISNVAPYGNVADHIEFVTYQHNVGLGCSQNIVNCLWNRTFETGAQQAMAATGANGVVGLINGGGTSGAYTGTGPVMINANHDIPWLARHEFLGHMIGALNDRYLNAALGGGAGVAFKPSNCSSNPNGESWWAQAGSTGAVAGCEAATLYSPFPNDPACPNGGNKNTIMANCPGATIEFDSVEKHWISNYILPNLSNAVNGGGGGTNNPPQTTTCTGGSTTSASTCIGWDIAPGQDFYQYPSAANQFQSPNYQDCKFACDADTSCRAYTWVPSGLPGSYENQNTCYLKNVVEPRNSGQGARVSGWKGSGTTPPTSCLVNGTFAIPPADPSKAAVTSIHLDIKLATDTDYVYLDIAGGLAPGTTSYTIRDLSSNTKYTVRTWMQTGAGIGNGYYAETRELTSPGCPVTPTPTNPPNNNPVTVNITVDKGANATYKVGDPIKVCYTVSRPVYVKLTNQWSDGTETLIIEGNDDGTGDCRDGTIGPPAGKECSTIQALTGANGSELAKKQACYNITATPTTTPTTTPTVTSTPTATPIPTSVPTATPTNIPTATVIPTAFATPIVTGTPTITTAPTLNPNRTTAYFVALIQGVGPDGGRRGFNPNPKRPTRALQYEIISDLNTVVARGTLDVTAKNAPELIYYEGFTTLEVLLNNTLPFVGRFRFDNTLWRKMPGTFEGDFLVVAAKELVLGDINQDNVLNLADYNAIISCYGAKSCSQKILTDLNDDGKIDEKDINIFYYGLATRQGD